MLAGSIHLLSKAGRFSLQSARFLSKETGTVKFFDSTKGFGFITPDNGGADIFVHQTSIHSKGFRSLADGEAVEFDVGDDQRTGKKVASNVTGPNGDFVRGAPRRERDMGMNNSRF